MMSSSGGKRLKNEEGGKRLADNSPQEVQPSGETEPKKHSPLRWVIPLIILLLALLAGGGYWAVQNGYIDLPAQITGAAPAETAAPATETPAETEAPETEAPEETPVPTDSTRTSLLTEQDLKDMVKAKTLDQAVASSGLEVLKILPNDYTGRLVYVDSYGLEVDAEEAKDGKYAQLDACVVEHLHDLLHDARFAVHPIWLYTGWAEFADGDQESEEHATGLAVDLTYFWESGDGKQYKVSRYTFANDSLYQDDIDWLTENAPLYGFVQTCETDSTGRSLAFHLVYVGVEAAQAIAGNGWTLAEYEAQLG